MSIEIIVDRDGWTGGLQVSIGDENGGHRICGPKYNGSSKQLVAKILTKSDVRAIREYLEKFDNLEDS